MSFGLTWPPESHPVSKKQNHVYSVPICNPPVNPFVSSKGILQSITSRLHCFCVSAEALDLGVSPEVAQDVSLLPVLSLEFSQLLTIRITSDPSSGPHVSAEPVLARLCSASSSLTTTTLLLLHSCQAGSCLRARECFQNAVLPPCALCSPWHYPVLVSSWALFSCPLTLFPLEGRLQDNRSSEPHALEDAAPQ